MCKAPIQYTYIYLYSHLDICILSWSTWLEVYPSLLFFPCLFSFPPLFSLFVLGCHPLLSLHSFSLLASIAVKSPHSSTFILIIFICTHLYYVAYNIPIKCQYSTGDLMTVLMKFDTLDEEKTRVRFTSVFYLSLALFRLRFFFLCLCAFFNFRSFFLSVSLSLSVCLSIFLSLSFFLFSLSFFLSFFLFSLSLIFFFIFFYLSFFLSPFFVSFYYKHHAYPCSYFAFIILSISHLHSRVVSVSSRSLSLIAQLSSGFLPFIFVWPGVPCADI